MTMSPYLDPQDVDEPFDADPCSVGPRMIPKKGLTLPSLILTEPKTMESVERALLEWAEKVADLESPLRREIAKDAAKKVLKAEGYSSAAAMVNMAMRTVQAKHTTQGQDLITPDPEPWPSPVDGSRLLTEMRDTFLRYCLLPHHAAEALALNALRTHVMDAFDFNPFTVLLSPVMRCGKTRVLDVSQGLVCRAMLVSGIRPAGFYRTVEESHPTLLLDEADTYDSIKDKYQGVLNSANHRSSAFHAVNVETRDGWLPRKFSTYAPVYLGLIGTLPPTVLDRSIVIPMKRKMKSENLVLFGPEEQASLTSLKRKAIRWGLDHVKALRKVSPSVPEGLDDRAADIWRPLLAIADTAGGDWPKLAREAAEALSGPDQREDESEGIALLRALRDILMPREKMRSADILKALNADEEGRWKSMNNGRGITGQDLGRMLKGFGVKRKTLYFPGDIVAKGYERAPLADAWTRYLTDLTELTRENNTPACASPGPPITTTHTEGYLPGIEIGKTVSLPEWWSGPIDREALVQALRDLTGLSEENLDAQARDECEATGGVLPPTL